WRMRYMVRVEQRYRPSSSRVFTTTICGNPDVAKQGAFPWRSQRQRATVSTCDIVSLMELRNASNGLCPESRCEYRIRILAPQRRPVPNLILVRILCPEHRV